MYLRYISFVICSLSFVHGANILAVVPYPSYSHQVAFSHLWRELSVRGHNVTVVTTDPLNDPRLTNLTEINMKWTYKYLSGISKVAENDVNMWNTYNVFHDIISSISEAHLSAPSIQDILHSGRSFDVVLVEFLFLEMLGFADVFKCPSIVIGSLDASAPYHREIMGNPAHPVLQPDFLTPFHRPLNFKERVISTLFDMYLTYIISYKHFSSKERILKKYFKNSLTLKQLLNDVDMMFLSSNPLIQGVRALGPTTINIGGYRPGHSPKQLPKDLENFLDNAKEGFIYFSLGSNVKSKELGEATLKAIIETLSEVPYKVLWKFEADNLPGKPENVKIIKWAPQQEILLHPNIKLFVTQGGLQSMEEAIYGEVPCVVIPFYGDQEHNAKLMESKGFAKAVGRSPIKKHELKSAILEVINNQGFKNSAKSLKRLIEDVPMTGLEKAVWWTEYVIRNKGAKHLRNPAADLPLYQYYLLDVIGFLLLVTVAVAATTKILIKLLVKLVLHVMSNKHLLIEKKIK